MVCTHHFCFQKHLRCKIFYGWAWVGGWMDGWMNEEAQRWGYKRRATCQALSASLFPAFNSCLTCIKFHLPHSLFSSPALSKSKLVTMPGCGKPNCGCGSGCTCTPGCSWVLWFRWISHHSMLSGEAFVHFGVTLILIELDMQPGWRGIWSCRRTGYGV